MIAPLERSLIRLTGLEPRAGEAGGGGCWGGGMDAAEGGEAKSPVDSSSGKRRTAAFADPPPSPRTPEHACEGWGGVARAVGEGIAKLILGPPSTGSRAGRITR